MGGGLYNVIFGYNPNYRAVLELADARPEDFGRFRDAWVTERDGKLVLAVHTRLGGPNRDEWKPVIDTVRQKPGYLADEDSKQDATYSTFFFALPPNAEHYARVLRAGQPDLMEDPDARWEAFLEQTKDGDFSTPEGQRALKFGEDVLKPAIERMKQGSKFEIVEAGDNPHELREEEE